MYNISDKELNYIKDFLSWELLAAKKCSSYASQEQDQEIAQAFDKCARTHQDNYVNVLSYLQQLEQNVGGGNTN